MSKVNKGQTPALKFTSNDDGKTIKCSGRTTHHTAAQTRRERSAGADSTWRRSWWRRGQSGSGRRRCQGSPSAPRRGRLGRRASGAPAPPSGLVVSPATKDDFPAVEEDSNKYEVKNNTW